MNKQRATLLRILLFFLLLVACFVYAARQMYEIQIVRHDELFKKAQQKYSAQKVERKLRGQIFDRNGYLLVGNKHVITIAFDPSVIKDQEQRRKIAHLLSESLPEAPNHTYAELFRRTGLGDTIDPETGELKIKKYVVLAKDVDYELAMDFRKKVRGHGLQRGMIFRSGTRRTYPKGSMLANVLGYCGDQNDPTKPMAGLEKALREEMSAQNSLIIYERAADGRPIGYGNSTTDNAGHDGNDVFLTISEPLQSIMETELDEMYKKTKAKAIYAVMADPYTGDILAMAQRPTFDPNNRESMLVPGSYNNRISLDQFEPGSVIKPFVVAMALDRGFITTESRIDVGFGPWKYAGKLLRDTHYIGNVKPWQIIQHSSNIGTAMIAVMMGADNLYNTLKAFQFGEKSGLPITPESSGLLRPTNKWSKLSVSRICIGHEMTVTPLQLLRAYCMLANGGYPVQLRLIDSLENDDGKKKLPYQISRKSVFINPNTHKTIVQMMKTVTKPGGTSAAAGVPGYEVAGKTGTANKIENGRYVKEKYFSSFCGFIPADKPEFVMIITCDEAKGEGSEVYGGAVAGPPFSRIAQQSLKFLGVPQDMTEEEWLADRKKCEKARWADVQRRERERLQKLGRSPKH